MSKQVLKYVLIAATLSVILGCLYCCTPQQKLNRLLRKHPELVKSDTATITKTFTVAGVSKDTTITLDTSTNPLAAIVDLYAGLLDSITKAKLTSQIHNYIVNRQVLLDTFYIPLARGGYVKIYQEGATLKHRLYQPATHVEIKCPVTINTTTYKDIPWRLPWYWAVIALFAGIAITFFVFIKFDKKKPDT